MSRRWRPVIPNALPPAVEAELSNIAQRMATVLEAVPPREALSALLAFNEKVSRYLEQSRDGPSAARTEDPA